MFKKDKEDSVNRKTLYNIKFILSLVSNLGILYFIKNSKIMKIS